MVTSPGTRESFGALVEEYSGVHLLRKRGHQFEVVTGRAAWLATNVIIATGCATGQPCRRRTPCQRTCGP